MKSEKLFIQLLLVFALASFIGCHRGTLEPGGAYAPVTTNEDGTITPTSAPDPEFFHVDMAWDLIESAVNTAFEYERNNRALLWQVSPEIKHTLDRIRPEAVEVRKTYYTARKAYKASPTPAGLTTLGTLLGRLQQVSEAVTAVVPKSNLNNLGGTNLTTRTNR